MSRWPAHRAARSTRPDNACPRRSKQTKVEIEPTHCTDVARPHAWRPKHYVLKRVKAVMARHPEIVALWSRAVRWAAQRPLSKLSVFHWRQHHVARNTANGNCGKPATNISRSLVARCVEMGVRGGATRRHASTLRSHRRCGKCPERPRRGLRGCRRRVVGPPHHRTAAPEHCASHHGAWHACGRCNGAPRAPNHLRGKGRAGAR